MNERSDIERVLRYWFDDGPAVMPDRVVDVVAARIAVNRQRRAWPFQRRTTVTPIKLIAGLAAALVVGVVGYNLLPGRQPAGGPGQGPPVTAEPSASPSTAPSTAPSASIACPQWLTTGCGGGAGILTAGSHATRAFRPGFTFSVPEGWVNEHDEAGYFALFPDTPANQAEWARSEGLAQTIFMGVHQSPWFTCESVENNRGATAAEMVTAMTANEVLAVSGLVDVTIGGLSGKQFDVRRNPDWTGTCPGDSGLPAGVDPEDERTRTVLLGVPGRGVLVIFIYSTSSAEHEAFLGEAMPIVESFEFELGQ